MRAARALLAIAVLTAGCEAASSPPAEVAFRLAAMAGAAPAPTTRPPALSLQPEPDPTPSPTPTPRTSKGGSGGGAPPPPGPVAFATEGRFALDRVGGAAPLTGVGGLAVDPDGTVYAADPARHAVWALAPSGAVVAVAGLGDGRGGYWGDLVPADATPLSGPMGLCRDPHSGALVVADAGNGRVRVFPPGGRIATWAGGGGSTAATVANARSALLDAPTGVAIDSLSRLWITERGSGRVRLVGADNRITTPMTLAAGSVGPIAVRWDGTRAWVGEGEGIRVVDPAAPDPAAAPIATWPGGVVLGLAYDQAGELYALVTEAGGLAGTRVYRLPVGADGTMPAGAAPEAIAGSGAQDASADAYRAPAATVSDARDQLLAGGALTGLAIDLSRASDPSVLSGHLYLGNAYESGPTRWGQVLRLTPIE